MPYKWNPKLKILGVHVGISNLDRQRLNQLLSRSASDEAEDLFTNPDLLVDQFGKLALAGIRKR